MKSTLVSRFGAAVRIAAAGAVAVTVAFGQPISDAAKQQIADIIATKKSFSAAEQKLSSRLAFGGRVSRFSLASTIASVVSNPADAQGMVTVDIKGIVSAQLLGQITGVGGQILSSVPRFRSIRARVPLAAVTSLAGNADVSSISEPAGYVVNSTPPAKAAAGAAQRRALMSSMLQRSIRNAPLLAATHAVPRVSSWSRPDGLAFFLGSLNTQGYVTHQAQQVIAQGYNGAGVKVGVLSDSASAARITALKATGDLPANTVVLPGQDGPPTDSDEGAAMMEIVADMAPGAQLYFATADISEAQFAANILALQAAGCSIIVDDVTYFDEAVFQDGPVAQAVQTVTDAGVLYISSAGNSGNLTDATSGTWEGDFHSGGPIAGPIATAGETGDVHIFTGSQTYDVLTGTTSVITLKWSDPLEASSNDYDLFLLNPAGTALTAFSAAVQSGTQNPYEAMGTASSFATNSRIVVVLFSGSTRALHLDTNRGRLSIATTGATVGHNAAAATLTAAATYWGSARTGLRPFNGTSNPVEVFSSDGPRKIFYNANGTAITAGNVLFGTNGGTTLQKPDLTAADGVSTRTPGFAPFYGTSAAAPHLAGIAALIKSARPSLTNAQIRAIMLNTALDNMAVGLDRDGGKGVAMALAAVQAALALP